MSSMYSAVPTPMLSSVFFFHRCSATTAATAISWRAPSPNVPTGTL